MLTQDGTLCYFSPCIEQVQRSCETLISDLTDIWTFEILLRMYEIREWKMDHSKLLYNHVPKKHTCYSRILTSHPLSDCNFSFCVTTCQQNTLATAGY
ncbi:hypothetical protein V6Z12_A13G275500 [Gossypium hirsutum]